MDVSNASALANLQFSFTSMNKHSICNYSIVDFVDLRFPSSPLNFKTLTLCGIMILKKCNILLPALSMLGGRGKRRYNA